LTELYQNLLNFIKFDEIFDFCLLHRILKRWAPASKRAPGRLLEARALPFAAAVDWKRSGMQAAL
jgi:hypothetical protein